uniref:RED-like N-terminal domain-containing protein n=1 Tax=Aegilops tauschii TaxID=37682 RepID=M8CWL2_AEGTA
MSDFEEMYNAKFRDQHYNDVCGRTFIYQDNSLRFDFLHPQGKQKNTGQSHSALHLHSSVYACVDRVNSDIATSLHRSKADCPVPEVLEQIAKIMSYLRFGSSGKVLKNKKKKRDTKDFLNMAITHNQDVYNYKKIQV